MITLTEFLKNEEYLKRAKLTHCNHPRNYLVAILNRKGFKDLKDYTVEKMGNCRQKNRTLVITDLEEFFKRLGKVKRSEGFKKGWTPINHTINSRTVRNCYEIGGDCSKCHYGIYQSITKCQTYEYILEELKKGREIKPNRGFIPPDKQKYLYLTGQINTL